MKNNTMMGGPLAFIDSAEYTVLFKEKGVEPDKDTTDAPEVLCGKSLAGADTFDKAGILKGIGKDLSDLNASKLCTPIIIGTTATVVDPICAALKPVIAAVQKTAAPTGTAVTALSDVAAALAAGCGTPVIDSATKMITSCPNLTIAITGVAAGDIADVQTKYVKALNGIITAEIAGGVTPSTTNAAEQKALLDKTYIAPKMWSNTPSIDAPAVKCAKSLFPTTGSAKTVKDTAGIGKLLKTLNDGKLCVGASGTTPEFAQDFCAAIAAIIGTGKRLTDGTPAPTAAVTELGAVHKALYDYCPKPTLDATTKAVIGCPTIVSANAGMSINQFAAISSDLYPAMSAFNTAVMAGAVDPADATASETLLNSAYTLAETWA